MPTPLWFVDQNGNETTFLCSDNLVSGYVNQTTPIPTLPADENLDKSVCYRLYVVVGV